MSKSFMGLISSPLFGVSNVVRYSGIKQMDREDVGIHTIRVQLLGSLIIKAIKEVDPSQEIDEGLFLRKALYHDLEEVFTGDIIRPTKYSHPDIKKHLDAYGEALMSRVFDGESFEVWRNAKEGREGLLLNVVDLLSCVQKVRFEVEYYGNAAFFCKIREVKGFVEKLEEELGRNADYFSFSVGKYLIDLVHEAIQVLDRMAHDNRDRMARILLNE